MLYPLLFVLQQKPAWVDYWDERVYISKIAVHKIVRDGRMGQRESSFGAKQSQVFWRHGLHGISRDKVMRWPLVVTDIQHKG